MKLKFQDDFVCCKTKRVAVLQAFKLPLEVKKYFIAFRLAYFQMIISKYFLFKAKKEENSSS
jgi:hypothetical protein